MMGSYTKAIIAALMAGLTAAVTILSQDPNISKWIVVAISVANVVAVLIAPNLPKTAADDINALVAALRTAQAAAPITPKHMLVAPEALPPQKPTVGEPIA